MKNNEWSKYSFKDGSNPVLAIQWNGDNLQEVMKYFDHYGFRHGNLRIPILNELCPVRRGDFIAIREDRTDEWVGVFSEYVFFDFFTRDPSV